MKTLKETAAFPKNADTADVPGLKTEAFIGLSECRLSTLQTVTLAMLCAVLTTTGCGKSDTAAKNRERPAMQTPTPDHSYKYTNALINEKSPYLLQHAHNPVNWYPWGEKAFNKARKENKPIFLSIGYSTCHWCHVMAHESFENEKIAAIMNKYFVCIKVDREERPDIDRVYMAYVQAATGSGGWPMSVWLTPDLKPFIGGTYFPPEDKWGRAGFKNVLLQIADAWKNDRSGIIAAGNGVIENLRAMTSTDNQATTRTLPDAAVLENGCRQIAATYDPVNGGFGGAPKFPQPSNLDFILRCYARSSDTNKLEEVLFTLRKMADGGIHDHIGGGFHRYAVDEHWHVPHFEKMLYDQAQLAATYLSAYQITHDKRYAEVAEDILNYVRRDMGMNRDEGAFYSAEDADSPLPQAPRKHGEGAFYIWNYDEIRQLLSNDEADVFCYTFNVKPHGNVTNDPQGEFSGKNILERVHTAREAATEFNISLAEVEKLLRSSRDKLFAVRAGRPRPHHDDKVITAWNAMMISAFYRAAIILDKPEYLARGEAAEDFIRKKLYDSKTGTLLRRWRDGEAAIDGYADDYAFFIQTLLDHYSATFDPEFIIQAEFVQQKMDEFFYDTTSGGYYSTSGKDKSVLLRLKESYDGAEPSANSVAVLNLLRLYNLTGKQVYRERAEQTLIFFGEKMRRAPQAMPNMLSALDAELSPHTQVIIRGRLESPATIAMLAEINHRFMPNLTVMFIPGEKERHTQFKKLITDKLKPLQNIPPGDNAAFLCSNFACRPPVSTPDALGDILDTESARTRKKRPAGR